MKTPHVASRSTVSPSIVQVGEFDLIPSHTALNWTVQTERTSLLRRLNSSKHPHAPEAASPERWERWERCDYTNKEKQEEEKEEEKEEDQEEM